MIDLKFLALRAGFFLVLLRESESRLGLEEKDRKEVDKLRDLLIEIQITSGANLEPDAQELFARLLGGGFDAKATILWFSRLVVLLEDLTRGGWRELSLHQKQFLQEEVNPILRQLFEAAK